MAEVRLKRFSFGQLFLCMILMLFSGGYFAVPAVGHQLHYQRRGPARQRHSYFPTKLSFYSYEYLFTVNLSSIGRAYGITVFITVVGTTLFLMIAPVDDGLCALT